MKIETPAEACACLAVLIAGADEVGTMEERRFIFENIAALPVFADFDRARFSKLMEDTTDWVWSEFPTEGGHITDDGVTKLVDMICGALTPDLRVEAFRAAVGLARSDGMTPEEGSLLERICAGLGIDPDVAKRVMEPPA